MLADENEIMSNELMRLDVKVQFAESGSLSEAKMLMNCDSSSKK